MNYRNALDKFYVGQRVVYTSLFTGMVYHGLVTGIKTDPIIGIWVDMPQLDRTGLTFFYGSVLDRLAPEDNGRCVMSCF